MGEVTNNGCLHSGLASRTPQQLASGIPVCVTVTQLDGLVYSRDAKYHSTNYRCVMCFRRGRSAGRDYTPAPSPHLASTAVVEVVIEDIRAKMREGGPRGPQDARDDTPGTSGVADV
jgi:hypothetical protein